MKKTEKKRRGEHPRSLANLGKTRRPLGGEGRGVKHDALEILTETRAVQFLGFARVSGCDPEGGTGRMDFADFMQKLLERGHLAGCRYHEVTSSVTRATSTMFNSATDAADWFVL